MYDEKHKVNKIFDFGDSYAFLFIAPDGGGLGDSTYDVINKKTGEVTMLPMFNNINKFKNSTPINISEIKQ